MELDAPTSLWGLWARDSVEESFGSVGPGAPGPTHEAVAVA